MDARIDTNEIMGDTRRYDYVIRTAGSVIGEHELMPHPLRVAVLCALLAASCGWAQSTQAPVSQGDVIARGNGVAIDRAELSASSREGSPHGGAPEPAGAALEAVVFEELRALRAVARGLDRDPGFTAEYRRAEARLRAWRRTQLAALAERQAGAEPVTVDEAQRYFAANDARVRGESVRPVVEQRLTEERRAGARDRLRAELLRGAP